jgi:transposase
MMGKSNKIEPKLFYHGISLERRIPQDHPLRRVKKCIDFTFARSVVEGLYGKNGNESIDPSVILKLMFLLFYENIKSERALASQLPLRLDWLWFCDYDIDETTPNHSVISKARRRWGLDVFARFFENILCQCIEAGLVDGRTIHIDSSTIAANASKERLRPKLELFGEQFYQQLDSQIVKQAKLNADKTGTKVTQVDPDARLYTKNGKTILGYKEHRVVDDGNGIITATITTSANVHDDKVLSKAVEEHIENTGIKPDKAVADKGYGFAANYIYLHDNDILPCIPHRNFDVNKRGKINRSEFTYDQQNDCYICPAGQQLHRYDHHKPYRNNSYRYRAKYDACRQCRLVDRCLSSKTNGRQVVRNIDDEYIEWADRCLSRHERHRLLGRRKYRAEGSFADASNNHGYKRARWRGIAKMQIQNLMIAAVQNIRKLLGHLGCGGRFEAVCKALSADFRLISARICLLIGRLIIE